MTTKQAAPDFHDMTRREIEDYIVELATIDDDFRKELLRDPVAALRAAGMPLRDGLSIRVLEQSESAYTILLPVKPKATSDLSEDELDQISGGVTGGHHHSSRTLQWP